MLSHRTIDLATRDCHREMRVSGGSSQNSYLPLSSAMEPHNGRSLTKVGSWKFSAEVTHFKILKGFKNMNSSVYASPVICSHIKSKIKIDNVCVPEITNKIHENQIFTIAIIGKRITVIGFI